MIEIKIIGRGGQGAVTAAYLLAKAAFYDKFYSQAYPMFGLERRGSPVESYVRIDEKPIKRYYAVESPDVAILLDPLLKPKFKSKTKIISNPESIDARKLSLKIFSKPIYNTIMLGKFAKETNIISLKSLLKASEEVWKGDLLIKNKTALKEGYDN